MPAPETAGEPVLEGGSEPSTTSASADGPGGVKAPEGRATLTMEEATAPDFLQQSLVLMPSETHGGEDLGIYAIGPWSHLFQGTVEELHLPRDGLRFRHQRAAGRRPRRLTRRRPRPGLAPGPWRPRTVSLPAQAGRWRGAPARARSRRSRPHPLAADRAEVPPFGTGPAAVAVANQTSPSGFVSDPPGPATPVTATATSRPIRRARPPPWRAPPARRPRRARSAASAAPRACATFAG